LALLLISCGGDKKDEGDDKNDDQVADDSDKKEGGGGGSPGTPADGKSAKKSKSLLGGIFSGKAAGSAMSRVDLTTAFGTALPSMKPAAAPAVSTGGSSTTARTFKGTDASKALWDLAPSDAAFGMVVAEGTGQELVAIMSEIERILDARPSGAALKAVIREGTGGDDFNIFKASDFANLAGLDLSKGFAVFMTSNEIPLIVLPVTDIEKFRTAVKADADELNDSLCPPHGAYRVCAENAAYAQAAIAAHDSPLRDRVTAMPKWLRGDMEIVAHLPSFEGAAEMREKLGMLMTDVGTFALATRMEDGAMSMRMWIEGKRGGQLGGTFANAPAATLTGENKGAINWFHMRLPPDLLALAEIPATIPMGRGMDLRRDVIDNLTGEVVAFSRGDMFLSEQITLALKDGAPAAKLVQGVCPFLGRAGLQKPRAGKGSCRGKVDLGKTLAKNPDLAPLVEGMPELDLKIAVVGNNLEIQLGGVEGPGKADTNNAGNAVTRELLTGNWNIVQWGMSFDPIASAPDVLADRLQKGVLAQLTGDDKQMVDALRWLYGRLYDGGWAVALRDDGMYAIAEVTTMAGDPAEVQQAHEAAVTKLLDGDIEGYREAMLALAKAHPKSLAANHVRNLDGGAPMLGQFGILGALAAFGQMKKKDDAMAVGGPDVGDIATALATDLCACKDKPCVLAIVGKFGELIKSGAIGRGDGRALEKVGEAGQKMDQCGTKLGVTTKEMETALGLPQ
jgi:hypothetical protein